MAGVLLLELFYNEYAPWRLRRFAPTENDYVRFFSAYLNYVSFSVYHVLCSIVVIGLVVFQLFKAPPEISRLALTFAVINLLFFSAVQYLQRYPLFTNVPGPGDTAAILDSSYGYLCGTLNYAGFHLQELKGIMPARCFDEGISALAWISWSQVLASYGASSLIGGFVVALCANIGAYPATERARLVEVSFRLCVIIFFNGTLGVLLMMRLPIYLVDQKATRLAAETAGIVASNAANQLASYAHSMTIYWGTEFTLAMFILFAPAVYFVNQRAAEQGEDGPLFADGSVIFVLTKPQNVLRLLGLLSPILIGLLGSIVSTIIGV